MEQDKKKEIDNLFRDPVKVADNPTTPPHDAPEVDVRTRWEKVRDEVKRILNITSDKEDPYLIIEQVRQDVDFRGTKLWILVCAIFVASLGLNVNSTAVIIGAMLISPLMGPIIGFGTALGIYDFDLLKRSLRNLALTTLFSIVTATIYFLITPFSENGSELLGRTTPNIYDVLIAFFGGAVGMIAGSTKSKGQVLPGVAIATALMPPLCTAGYGIATGQWNFFFGAFYLYLINSVFIAFATYIVVRSLKFPQKVFVNALRKQKVQRIMLIVALCTLLPSIYLSIGLVQDSIRRQSAKTFVEKELDFADAQVVKYDIVKEQSFWTIDVVMVGRALEPRVIDSLKKKLPDYVPGALLNVHQGFEEKADLGQLKTDLLKDLYENSEAIIQRQRSEIDSLKHLLERYGRYGAMEKSLAQEMKALFPNIKNVYIASPLDLAQGADSVLRVVLRPEDKTSISNSDRERLTSWLKTRSNSKYVAIVIDNSK